MITVFDEYLQRIVTSLNQCWIQIRARKLGFEQREEMSFVTDAIMLAGVTSLLCRVDVKDLPDPEVEYYPIYLKLVDPLGYAPELWLTLARKGRTIEIRAARAMAFQQSLAALIET